MCFLSFLADKVINIQKGDLSLIFSAPWLLFRIRKLGIAGEAYLASFISNITKKAGISLETQILRLVVFAARYLC